MFTIFIISCGDGFVLQSPFECPVNGQFLLWQGLQSSSPLIEQYFSGSPKGPYIFGGVQQKIVIIAGTSVARARWALPESGDITSDARENNSINSFT